MAEDTEPAASAAEADPAAVFEREATADGGERILPTRFAQGPWDRGSAHGGAVCALLTRSLERVPTLAPMRFVRIGFDLMRPIPLRPLTARTRVVREGKRIQLVEATLFSGELPVARATGQRIRLEPGLDTGANPPREVPLPTTPGEGVGPLIRIEAAPGYIHAMDFLRGDGEPDGRSARTLWLRFRVPMVAGEPTSPLVRLAGACDLASGAANALDFQRFHSINPDVSLHIHHEPRTEWLAVHGTTELRTDGTGQSEADLYDEHGRIARAMTSLLVARVSGEAG